MDTERFLSALRDRTGVIIPVCIPPDTDFSMAERMVRDTVNMFLRELSDPAVLCVSADGGGAARTICEGLAGDLGIQAVFSEASRGKLSAVRNGMACLLGEKRLAYFAVADQDGDHFANELLNFVRAALHVERHMNTKSVLVLGRRISRHRPMGFARGEFEDFADRILLEALQFRAAKDEEPLRLQFASSHDPFPDFHSGYKLFSRETSLAVFASEPRLCDVTEDCYYRHACEAVMSVEAMQSGAVLAVVNRSTVDEQQVSSFGLLDRQRLVADKIIWPCKRLGVPAKFVQQWMANHLPAISLGTLVPEGQEELRGVRRLVLQAFGITEVPSPEEDRIMRMPFV